VRLAAVVRLEIPNVAPELAGPHLGVALAVRIDRHVRHPARAAHHGLVFRVRAVCSFEPAHQRRDDLTGIADKHKTSAAATGTGRIALAVVRHERAVDD